MPGAGELAARVFGKQVRIAGPTGVTGLGDAVSGPAFSAVAGIVRRETRGAAEAISGPPRMGGFTVAARRSGAQRARINRQANFDRTRLGNAKTSIGRVFVTETWPDFFFARGGWGTRSPPSHMPPDAFVTSRTVI